MAADWRLVIVGGLLLALAGCQTGGNRGAAADAAAKAGAADTGANAGAAVATGDKSGVCTAEVVKKFSVTADNVSLSNEYPHNDGDAIDGAATLAADFQRFRCEFNRAGALTAVVNIEADS